MVNTVALDPNSIRELLKPVFDMRAELAETERRRLENHKENGDKRHAAAQETQKLLLTQEVLKGRIDAHDVQFRALIGDGAGTGGILNELKIATRENGVKMDAVLRKMDIIDSKASDEASYSREQTDKYVRWGVILAVLTAIAGVVLWLLTHGLTVR